MLIITQKQQQKNKQPDKRLLLEILRPTFQNWDYKYQDQDHMKSVSSAVMTETAVSSQRLHHWLKALTQQYSAGTTHTSHHPYLSELITHYLHLEPYVLPTQIS